MRRDLNTDVGLQAADFRKMMQISESSSALLTKATERLDAATEALMSEKTEYTLAKEQLQKETSEFALVNVELEKALAMAEEIVTMQRSDFVTLRNDSGKFAPAPHISTEVSISEAKELASVRMELEKAKKEFTTAKNELRDAVWAVESLDEKSDLSQNGVKEGRQDGREYDHDAMNGTIQNRGKEQGDIGASIIEEVKKELKAELKAELMSEIKDSISHDIIEHVKSDIKNEFIKHEIKDAISHEITECIKPDILNELHYEMKTHLLKRVEALGKDLRASLDHEIRVMDETNKYLEKEVMSRIDEKLKIRLMQEQEEGGAKKHRGKHRKQRRANGGADA